MEAEWTGRQHKTVEEVVRLGRVLPSLLLSDLGVSASLLRKMKTPRPLRTLGGIAEKFPFEHSIRMSSLSPWVVVFSYKQAPILSLSAHGPDHSFFLGASLFWMCCIPAVLGSKFSVRRIFDRWQRTDWLRIGGYSFEFMRRRLSAHPLHFDFIIQREGSRRRWEIVCPGGGPWGEWGSHSQKSR